MLENFPDMKKKLAGVNVGRESVKLEAKS